MLPPTGAPKFEGELEFGMPIVVAYTAHKYPKVDKTTGAVVGQNVGQNVVWVAVLGLSSFGT